VPDTDFHFLRPWALLFVPYAIWLHLRLRRAYSAALQWQDAIEPELLRHLTVAGHGRRRLRPYHWMTAMLIFLAVTVAGPTWEREVTPFTQDRAPLVIAIELTPSMLGVDQQPTRLERARHKAHDLLQRRKGARTAVLGYAGSAHVLLPFTDDTELLDVYLEALEPDLMPREGDEPAIALAAADRLLAGEDVAGTVLFMTDGVDRTHADTFAEFSERTGDQVLFLAFGTDTGDAVAPPVDRGGLDAVASAAGGTVLAATLGEEDVDALMRRVRTHLVNAIEADEALAWKDRGYPLAWAVAGCMLLWFRRGWTVQWRL
jgi:Ca-activated chloride channel family protein